MIWVSEFHAGQLGRYDPKTDQWQEWPLPGPGAPTYAVYVDDQDVVWASDFGTGTIVRFLDSLAQRQPARPLRGHETLC